MLFNPLFLAVFNTFLFCKLITLHVCINIIFLIFVCRLPLFVKLDFLVSDNHFLCFDGCLLVLGRLLLRVWRSIICNTCKVSLRTVLRLERPRRFRTASH